MSHKAVILGSVVCAMCLIQLSCGSEDNITRLAFASSPHGNLRMEYVIQETDGQAEVVAVAFYKGTWGCRCDYSFETRTGSFFFCNDELEREIPFEIGDQFWIDENGTVEKLKVGVAEDIIIGIYNKQIWPNLELFGECETLAEGLKVLESAAEQE